MSFDPQTNRATHYHTIKGTSAKSLNQALKDYRKRNDTRALHYELVSLTPAISRQLYDFVYRKATYPTVQVTAHLVGKGVQFQFTLFHCVQGQWVEERQWKAKIKDERDESVSVFYNIANYEEVTWGLIQGLTEFINQI